MVDDAERNMTEQPRLAPFLIVDAAHLVALLAELHLPQGREIGLEVGPMAAELYDALRVRTNDLIESMGPGEEWLPDPVDLAAIRVLSAAVLRHCPEPDFVSRHGHGFEFVRSLQAKATARLRQRADLGWGATTVWVGDRRFQFPSRIIRREDGPVGRLVATPSVSSWDLVYSDAGGALAARDEAIGTLVEFGHARGPQRLEEFDAESYWELEQKATDRARELSAIEPGRIQPNESL